MTLALLLGLLCTACALVRFDAERATERMQCEQLAMEVATDDCVDVEFAETCQVSLDSECLFDRASQELGDRMCAHRMDVALCHTEAQYNLETGECMFRVDSLCVVQNKIHDVVDDAKKLFSRFRMK